MAIGRNKARDGVKESSAHSSSFFLSCSAKCYCRIQYVPQSIASSSNISLVLSLEIFEGASGHVRRLSKAFRLRIDDYATSDLAL